jgi:putative oxidoreductase
MIELLRNDAAGKLVLRLTVGILMLFHGVSKLMHSGSVDFIGSKLTEAGLPALLAYGVYVGEVVAPVMILLGVFSRVGGLIVVINMLFAVLLVHTGDILFTCSAPLPSYSWVAASMPSGRTEPRRPGTRLTTSTARTACPGYEKAPLQGLFHVARDCVSVDRIRQRYPATGCREAGPEPSPAGRWWTDTVEQVIVQINKTPFPGDRNSFCIAPPMYSRTVFQHKDVSGK